MPLLPTWVRLLKSPNTGSLVEEEPARGRLTVDYVERRVAVADCPVDLTEIENRSWVSCFGGFRARTIPAARAPVRAIVRRLRRKLGDDAGDPAYIFTRRRAGYWIEKGETLGP